MFKVYKKYLIKKFLIKFLIISLIFFSLTIILNILEEISFFKNKESSFIIPYFLTLLNSPITLFEVFPFIFLISTQLLFFEIFNKNELILLKSSGLSNLKIIKTLFISSLLLGFFMIAVYYNIASKLKFYYTDIKNNFTNDNKYLAVVNDSGLWLKDEINSSVLIVKSNEIKNNFLINVIINQFDFTFNHIKTIQSEKVDISSKNWVIYSPIITEKNNVIKNLSVLNLQSNFDKDKINTLFSNFSTLNLLQLFNLKEDYEDLGYSSDEVMIHLLKLFSHLSFYALMTVLSSVIMFNVNKNINIFSYCIWNYCVCINILYKLYVYFTR